MKITVTHRKAFFLLIKYDNGHAYQTTNLILRTIIANHFPKIVNRFFQIQ